jgi:diacylglycerol kinase family enzyme
VLGGDGTVMEVLGALAHSGIPVGILPGGTGNLVAHSLGIPLNTARAVDALVRGRTRAMDLGITGGGHRFAFSVGAGVDSRMIAETSAGAKRTFGPAAYAYTALRCALAPRSFEVRAEVDGIVIERTAAAVMVANSGGVLDDLITLGPGIRNDDGLLDICIFSPRGTAQAVAVGWRLFTARFDGHPAIFHRAAKEFRIECDPPQLLQADGELLGDTPFEARVEAGAATVIVPDP